MSNQIFYFRSFQVMVLLLIVTVISGCSLYPTIEQRKTVSSSSTLLAPPMVGGIIASDDRNEIGPKENEGINSMDQEVTDSTTDSTDKSESFISEETDQIIQLDDILEQVEPEQEVPSATEATPQSKKIAITFDDGPDLKFTPQILDILNEKDVKATFFVVGIQVNKYPDMLKRIEEEGHLIGNHSYYHPSFTKLNRTELEKEITTTDEAIFAALGHVPNYVRPPYGAINDEVSTYLESMGKEVVLWNIDPRDWDGTSVEDMYQNIVSNAKDGGNILLHSFGSSKNVANTVKLLPLIIDHLHEQGYQFVTAEQL